MMNGPCITDIVQNICVFSLSPSKNIDFYSATEMDSKPTDIIKIRIIITILNLKKRKDKQTEM